ncbi:MAG TPA: hypothetical protein VFE46_00155 [Pirellulales bacterium]|nr:hypothetical protein [Pirellulales bacterium]
MLAIPVGAASAADPPASAQQLVVLRNGEVLSGAVSRQGDRYIIASAGTEIRLASRDVDFLCETLDEAYQVQHNRELAGRIDDRLNLAEWCLRQKLLGYAAREIAAAMEIDAKNPRVAVLDTRIQRELQPDVPKAVTASDSTNKQPPVSADELERMVRSLPPTTVETFTSTIQPMLLNYCATAGCHGPSSPSSFTLVRSPYEKIATRHLTERNLYNTMQWIDRQEPLDSKLLSAAREPHGPNQASGATGVGTTKYQELMNWVLRSSPTGNARLQPRLPATMPGPGWPLGEPPVLASPSPTATLMPPGGLPPALGLSPGAGAQQSFGFPTQTGMPDMGVPQRNGISKIRRAPNTAPGNSAAVPKGAATAGANANVPLRTPAADPTLGSSAAQTALPPRDGQ